MRVHVHIQQGVSLCSPSLIVVTQFGSLHGGGCEECGVWGGGGGGGEKEEGLL